MSAGGELERILRDLESIRDRVNSAIEVLRPAVEPEEPETVNFTDEDAQKVLVEIRKHAPSTRDPLQVWTTRAALARETGLHPELVGRIIRRLQSRGDIQTKGNNRWIAAASLREARLRVGEGEVG